MKLDIIRAWKDEEYRQGLGREALAVMPTSPIGDIDLTDQDLGPIDGSFGATTTCCTFQDRCTACDRLSGS